jgi:hypothetical protein
LYCTHMVAGRWCNVVGNGDKIELVPIRPNQKCFIQDSSSSSLPVGHFSGLIAAAA